MDFTLNVLVLQSLYKDASSSMILDQREKYKSRFPYDLRGCNDLCTADP